MEVDQKLRAELGWWGFFPTVEVFGWTILRGESYSNGTPGEADTVFPTPLCASACARDSLPLMTDLRKFSHFKL